MSFGKLGISLKSRQNEKEYSFSHTTKPPFQKRKAVRLFLFHQFLCDFV